MIDQPTKRAYPKWGRAQTDELCRKCKRDIVDGEKVLRLSILEGTLCFDCGSKREGD